MIDLMPKWRLLILFIVAFAATWVIFKPTLRIALGKNIVDNPEARKLQDHPVPILGGVVVFFGIAVVLSELERVGKVHIVLNHPCEDEIRRTVEYACNALDVVSRKTL